MSDAPELKPCPFCGGKAIHNDGGNSVFGRFWWSVGCAECGVVFTDREVWDPDSETSQFHPDYPPQECFALWNTRAAPKVKPLDLSNLIKHAFVAGRTSAMGSGSLDMEAWSEYDPEDCASYARILEALQ